MGRNRATPTTPVEIDGAAQVWHLSAHYAQFRAPAFPSPVPCRSRCRALAGLARARTSDDIRPRALCTPPPKSFTRSPRTLHPANAATGITVWSASFAPGVHFGADSDLCATAYIAGAAGPHSMRRATAGWIPCDFESDRRRRPLKKAAASAAGRRNDEQIRQLGHLGRSGIFHESDCPQISDIQAAVTFVAICQFQTSAALVLQPTKFEFVVKP